MHDEQNVRADLVIINTCGFILDAKEESVDTIMHYIGEKRDGNIGKLFVMGCLSERYREDLKVRTARSGWLFWSLGDGPASWKRQEPAWTASFSPKECITTPSHYAYLKISEGCNRTCAFCAIPGIRGKQQSISIDHLVRESRSLVQGGVKELILIAQDLTSYGIDIYQHRALADLLRELVRIDGLEWIRLHYAYPTGFPEEVIELMASEEKICNYMDIPIQHVNDQVLSDMGRGHDRKKLEKSSEPIQGKGTRCGT